MGSCTIPNSAGSIKLHTCQRSDPAVLFLGVFLPDVLLRLEHACHVHGDEGTPRALKPHTRAQKWSPGCAICAIKTCPSAFPLKNSPEGEARNTYCCLRKKRDWLVNGHARVCVHMCVRVRVCEHSRGHGGVPAYPLVLADADLLEDINSKYFKKHNLTIKRRGGSCRTQHVCWSLSSHTARLLESVLAHVRAHTWKHQTPSHRTPEPRSTSPDAPDSGER